MSNKVETWKVTRESVRTDYIVIENLEQFLAPKPPKLHPEHPDYIYHWSRETKRCIEGIWGEEFGQYRYCPGRLYFFGSYTILEHTLEDKTTIKMRPKIFDLMWDFAYQSTVAYGFSGFENDNEYSCNRNILLYKEGKLDKKYLSEHCFYKNQIKKYVDPWEYIQKLHNKSLGRCLYENPTQNRITFGSRGGGKSYYEGLAEIEYNFVFGGAKYYNDKYRQNLIKCEQLIGSSDANRSSELLAKFKVSQESKTDSSNRNFREWFGIWGVEGDEDFTPSPFFKRNSGTLKPANKPNPYRDTYKIINNGQEREKGRGSKIFHVNYSDKKGDGAEAGAGGRYLYYDIEEAGLCFGKGTKVRMYDTTVKNIEDIEAGDLVMGYDGSKRTVKGVTSGNKELYKVKQTFGDDYIVNKGHPLMLFERYKNHNKYHQVAPEEFLKWRKSRKKETYGYKNKSLVFEKDIEEGFRLSPRWLGMWIGDGGVKSNTIHTVDFEIVDYLQDYADKLGLKLRCVNRSKNPENLDFYRCNIIDPTRKKNPITRWLQEKNIYKRKDIPNECLKWSRQERLELLAGLLDTDGCLNERGGVRQAFEFYQTNRKYLIEKVHFLATSLGYRASISSRIVDKGYGSKIIGPRVKYRVRISGKIWEIPTLIKRKQAVEIVHKKDHLKTAIKVEEIGKGDYYGFTLKEDPKFLLRDGTVVHNTKNVIDILGSNEGTITRGGTRFGVGAVQGTSGNIDFVQGTKKIFLNPQDYFFLSYPNKFGKEGKNGRIGYFLPFYMTLLKFKDSNGNTDYDAAIAEVNRQRQEKADSDDPQVLRHFLMNKPCFVREMWLTDRGYHLPYEEAAVREQELMAHQLYKSLGRCVELIWDDSQLNGVRAQVLHDYEPITEYPLRKDMKDPSGCVVIYEDPQTINGHVPNDMYNFVGHDPYVAEELDRGGSLGTTYVLKNPKYIPHGYTGNIIVATYIGKPAKNGGIGGLEYYYGQQERLLALYGNPPNALAYEANRGEDCRNYYIRKHKLYLLMQSPQWMQGNSTHAKTVTRTGYLVGGGNSSLGKLRLLKLFNDWLLEETTFIDKDGNHETKLNIQRFPCIFTVRQIMQFNLEENFDGVMGMLGCIVALREYQSRVINDTKVSTRRKNTFSTLLSNSNIFDSVKIKSFKKE